MPVLWLIRWRKCILLISFSFCSLSTGAVSFKIWFINTVKGKISQVFNYSGIEQLKSCFWEHQKQISTNWTCDNGRTVLTLCPFSPGRPGSPSKPLSPCIETQQNHQTAQDQHTKKVLKGFSKPVAMLYENNRLFLICSQSHEHERLCHGIWYLGAWLSRHSTAPVSSGTTLRNTRRKNNYTYCSSQ